MQENTFFAKATKMSIVVKYRPQQETVFANSNKLTQSPNI